MIFAVIFPFTAAFLVWFLFKNRHSERIRSVPALIMIIVSILELAASAWFIVFLYAKQFMKNDTRVIRYDFLIF